MRIIDTIDASSKFISLEFFPPKELDKWPAFFEVVGRLTELHPQFVSVTYGAGGSTQDYTLEIVTRLKQEFGLEPMAHLTCVGADEKAINEFLDSIVQADIDNVLALRGDPPKGMTDFTPDNEAFQHASDLVRFIKDGHPNLGVGVAGYPEKHPQAPTMDFDLEMLQFKLDQGADIVVTQLFFDPKLYFDFVDKVRAMGVTAPIIPGILPVLNLETVKRFTAFCGASIPPNYLAALEKANSEGGTPAVRELGLDYAAKQVQALLDGGAPGAHLYTLNKAEACLDIVSRLSL